MKHGCHLGKFERSKRAIFMANLQPKDNKNDGNNNTIFNDDFNDDASSSRFHDSFNYTKRQVKDDPSISCFSDAVSSSGVKSKVNDGASTSCFNYENSGLNRMKRKFFDDINNDGVKRIKVTNDNSVPRHKYDNIKEKLYNYKLSYSRLMHKHMIFKEKSDEKYNSLLKTLNGIKIEEANKSIIIEKYKEAIATAQKLAMDERAKHNELKSKLNNTRILGNIYYLSLI